MEDIQPKKHRKINRKKKEIRVNSYTRTGAQDLSVKKKKDIIELLKTTALCNAPPDILEDITTVTSTNLFPVRIRKRNPAVCSQDSQNASQSLQSSQSLSQDNSMKLNVGSQITLWIKDKLGIKYFKISKCEILQVAGLKGVAKDPDDGIKYDFEFNIVRGFYEIIGNHDETQDWKPRPKKSKSKSLINPNMRKAVPKISKIQPEEFEESLNLKPQPKTDFNASTK